LDKAQAIAAKKVAPVPQAQSKRDARIKLFVAVSERDRHCKGCGCPWTISGPKFDAHHITDRHEMPNNGNVLENLIFLCSTCHWEAEAYHRNEVPKDGFWPDQLYELIGSSYEKAVAASEGLSEI
jgi:5-methylcytosine-specific restriction endonuclease McrA